VELVKVHVLTLKRQRLEVSEAKPTDATKKLVVAALKEQVIVSPAENRSTEARSNVSPEGTTAEPENVETVWPQDCLTRSKWSSTNDPTDIDFMT
jgi:hypothetical protein